VLCNAADAEGGYSTIEVQIDDEGDIAVETTGGEDAQMAHAQGILAL
jgi:hypothetical protein